MAKIRILSPNERKTFQLPPIFQPAEKSIYFELTDTLKKVLGTFHSPARQVGFVLQWGYFKRVGRFFSPTLFHKQDLQFVAQLLGFDHRSIQLAAYKEHRLFKDQKNIMALQGFQSFDRNKSAQILLEQEVTHLVTQQMRPKMMIYYLSNFFFQKKIEIPSYPKLAETTTQALDQFEERLLLTLEKNITDVQARMLDQLLLIDDPKNRTRKNSYYQRAPLVTLCEIPLSAKPGKIKESLNGFLDIKQIFEIIKTTLDSLQLSPGSLKYYAIWVQKAKITQLVQINDPYKRYLYLIAFVAHQYYCRQDLLIDTLLQSVQSTLNSIDKKLDLETRKNQQEKDHATKILSTSYRDKTELLKNIQSIIDTPTLSSDEKIEQLKVLLHQTPLTDPAIVACIEKLEYEINDTLNNTDFYSQLEKNSIFLQNRLSTLVKHLEFNVLNSTSPLLKAIKHYKNTSGQIGKNPPVFFLTEQAIQHLYDEKKHLRISLYKALLFIKIAAAIKSGELNLIYSYRYLSIDEYLISKSIWQSQRENYLVRASLEDYATSQKTITPLQDLLDQHYIKTNENIAQGKNTLVSFNKKGEFFVETPRVEKAETQKISELILQKNYVSILDVLASVDQITDFSTCLQHYSVKQQVKKPASIVFYAGLIGKGCNIGLNKLASVSKGINEHTLETVVNWYFTNDHLIAANNRIIRFINRLTLPNIMKRTSGKLHTASDGQKRNVDADSILANFSFKYHGSGRGVSIYDFIDERHVLFHSLVMSSSEREAAYVIDGLMCNDEIKSDIHSTDTHGYTDLIFAITHLLGISFAPRLAKLKKHSLYAFEARKSYQKKGYQILPDHTINLSLIEENWEDILRLVTTIKLKETTASQILKRLSSYSKNNPLYKALKEFGKIIKSIFILTYIDDLELRQAIQKQLNKIELANKFSDAVFFDNNQEFKQATREEQELAMNCKIILQNAIVLWNYLYLSQLLATTTDLNKQDELLKIIKNGSIMSWIHINMLGEYDFRNKQASNQPIFDVEKILAWRAH